MARGEARKRRTATKMNARSSRAHALVVLTLAQGAAPRRRSQLFLADLGGSEQLKRSEADAGAKVAAGIKDGEATAKWAEYYEQRRALREAQNINLGLFALKRCVDALRAKKAFVPYQDSKLTLLLQAGLGGAAKTAVIVAAASCAPGEPRGTAQSW